MVKLNKLIKFLEANGFYKRSQSGSHAVYKNNFLKATISIPMGSKDAQHYILKQSMRALRLTQKEFEKKLKDF